MTTAVFFFKGYSRTFFFQGTGGTIFTGLVFLKGFQLAVKEAQSTNYRKADDDIYDDILYHNCFVLE